MLVLENTDNKMTEKILKLGFELNDVKTLEEAKEMELKNLEIDYNECGGYIDGYDKDDNQVVVCYHENSDIMYEYGDEIIEYLQEK